MLIDLIPVQYRMLAGLVALTASLAAASGAGAVINGWRVESSHAHEIIAQKADYAALLAEHNALKLSVEQQNGAVKLMQVKADEAEVRRQQAEKYAAGIIATTDKRIADAKNSKATTCDGVLRDAWGWK